MPAIGYVNGRFGPLEEAVVSVEDRGFQFGDGVYEVIRTYGGRPFHLDAHLARLERSAKAIGLALPQAIEAWRGIIEEGLRLARLPESKIYLQVTRGAAPRDHLFPPSTSPTTVMTIRAMRPVEPALRDTGVEAVTAEDQRWGRCDVKSVNLLPNVLVRQAALEQGAFEAILVRDGEVTEGAVSNVVVVRGGVVQTAPEGPRILSGVTRSLVLDLARSLGSVRERAVTVEELYGADEVFLTGTTIEILPVVRVDGRTIGPGVPGAVTKSLYGLFQRLVR